ncbi:MAG: hypothetical protein KBT29_04585, partial [Prevotellaceae bacterium]|nr:hypothetical protein [Candidatus Minthosoma caballi]
TQLIRKFMRENYIPKPPFVMIIPFDAYPSRDGTIHFRYSKKIDTMKSDYYRNRIFLIDYIKIKRVINQFLADNLRQEETDSNHISGLANTAIEQYFYLTIPLLDKSSIHQFFRYDEGGYKEFKDELAELESDDNKLVEVLLNICFRHLTERIEHLYGSVPLGVLNGEFLRIIDATIDHFSAHTTMCISDFVKMFHTPPKLLTEQWSPNFCSIICVYPWRAFELVLRLEEFMEGKKDKDAMLYVHAAIEAGVVFREWKRFELQFGTKYCSRKTYNQYTDTRQKNAYYTQAELTPLIEFFKEFKPSWAQKG